MNTASITKGKLNFMRHENGEELLFDVTMEKPAAFNLEQDFHESVNLTEIMPEETSELRQELETFMQTLPIPHYQGGFHDSLYDFINRR
ncbi:MAG: hypothetical protein COA78_29670 [Blastopirellula sp.]|nr:MAG: hypothetical protein COA78_29670 [Blastopirellula sp.]